MKKVTEQHLEDILTKMFEVVGETYSPSAVKGPEWYLKHSWTKEQQHLFCKWLTEYINKEWKFSKATSAKEAKAFIFNYGWRLDDTE
jgi:hypothetical protein